MSEVRVYERERSDTLGFLPLTFWVAENDNPMMIGTGRTAQQAFAAHQARQAEVVSKYGEPVTCD